MYCRVNGALAPLQLFGVKINAYNKSPPRLLWGSQQGGFQKGGFGGCSWTPKPGMGAQKNRNDGTQNWNRRTCAKPPFYKTALLFPLDR